MEILNTFTSVDIATLVILSVLLLGGLLALRVMFKLTATLFRVGCFIVFLIVAAAGAFLFAS